MSRCPTSRSNGPRACDARRPAAERGVSQTTAMASIAYWIQRADFSASDHETVTSEGAIEVLRSHNWEAESRLQAEFEAAGKECCPPGIGFLASDGPILHICPTIGGTSMVHFHPTRARGRLDVLRSSKAVHTKLGVEQAEVVELIHWCFAGRHDWIQRKLPAA